jgi:DMSO/TMAO reductase YedYZ molybdopterin-dependent catalytic subunit
MAHSPKSNLYLPRRRFLQISGLSAIAATMAGCGVSLYDETVFKVTEPLNEQVEQLLFKPHKLIPEFPASTIEPEALLINTFDTAPQLNPQRFRLQIDGEVAHPLLLSLDAIAKMPLATMTIRHICVEGWSAIVQWAGIRLRDLVQQVQPAPTVRYVYFKSADGYYESWDLNSVMHPQTLLAHQKNGQPLPVENGAPLRLASPIKLGYKQSKWITQITFLTQKPKLLGYWEDQGYEWYAGI